jgi:NAD(P)-dependent dehydrogenase (short-subunit alcohol dehydrogenase family)
MATALGGTMLLSHCLLPTLKKAKSPRIINVSSGGAYTVKALKEDLNSEKMSKYDGTLIYVSIVLISHAFYEATA